MNQRREVPVTYVNRIDPLKRWGEVKGPISECIEKAQWTREASMTIGRHEDWEVKLYPDQNGQLTGSAKSPLQGYFRLSAELLARAKEKAVVE